jgi:hypothetical protein
MSLLVILPNEGESYFIAPNLAVEYKYDTPGNGFIGFYVVLIGGNAVTLYG